MARARTILITGCSSGIGLDAARTLHASGEWRVFACCRKEEDVDAMRARHGIESFLIDYSKPETIERGFEDVMRETGGTLDALFNNGAHGSGGAAEDIPTDALRAIFEVNFFGWHDLTRRAVKAMRAQGGRGRIVQCSSILGNVVMPMRMAYSATKFALEAHCDALRLELSHDTDIKIISLNVGPIRTKIRENSRAHFERWIAPLVEVSAFRSFYEKKFVPRLYGPYKKDMGELEPSAVTAKLTLALDARRPAPRYSVTWPTHAFMFLKRILPGWAFDQVTLRAMGLWPAAKKLHP